MLQSKKGDYSSFVPSFRPHLHFLPPNVLVEPLPIVPQRGQSFFGFVDAVPKSLVHDQFGGHLIVLQTLQQFVRIRNRHPAVKFAVLNQGRGFGVFDVGHRGGFAVNFRVTPGGGLQILPREGMDIGAHVIGHPVGNTRTYRDGFETVGIRGQKSRNVAILAPAHTAHTVGVHATSGNQKVDTRHDVPHVAYPEVAHIE